MNLPNDIASILTDLSTIDITDMTTSEIEEFIKLKGIRFTNHLPSGSPISSILSYLSNMDMFEELNKLAKRNNCIVSFYVDDIIFLFSVFRINCNGNGVVSDLQIVSAYFVSCSVVSGGGDDVKRRNGIFHAQGNLVFRNLR